MGETAIEVRGLRKSYGALEAVRGIDLQVQRGEVFALLGPNGAGKTTTVEILEGHRSRDAGDVRVLGHDPGVHERALKRRIGIVLQETGVQPYLTVDESVRLYRDFYPSPRPVDDILAVVGLLEQRDILVRRLSGGQQRRLDVAIGLAGDPELLFLDEPTTGFDPTARRGAWEMIRALRELGKTVFLTTHYMDEAQALADRLAIIARGKVVAEGTPRELIRGGGAATIAFEGPVDGLPARLREAAVVEGARVRIRTDDAVRDLHELTGWALEHAVTLEHLEVSRASLEDVFVELTKEEQ